MPSTGQTECTFNLFLERGSLMSLQAVVEVRAHPTVRLCFKLGDTSQAYGRKKKNSLHMLCPQKTCSLDLLSCHSCSKNYSNSLHGCLHIYYFSMVSRRPHTKQIKGKIDWAMIDLRHLRKNSGSAISKWKANHPYYTQFELIRSNFHSSKKIVPRLYANWETLV